MSNCDGGANQARTGIAIIGAGAWGTTLATLIAQSHSDVTLATHSREHAHDIGTRRENVRYLPGVLIPETVHVTANADDAVRRASIVFVVVPSQRVRDACAAMVGQIERNSVIICCAKGFELSSGKRLSEVIAETLSLPQERLGVVSGPNLAREIAAGQPASTVVACAERATAARVQEALNSSNLRVYSSVDVVGVEYGGALKNVVAIGAGVADGLGLGQNAKAAFMTRGLVEMVRLGSAAGANPLTFGGLSGIGDLIATCESPLSRNRSFGELLGQGMSSADAMAATPHVVEGVITAQIAIELGRRYGVETPIAAAVHAVIEGRISVRDAIEGFMARGTRPELDGPAD